MSFGAGYSGTQGFPMNWTTGIARAVVFKRSFHSDRHICNKHRDAPDWLCSRVSTMDQTPLPQSRALRDAGCPVIHVEHAAGGRDPQAARGARLCPRRLPARHGAGPCRNAPRRWPPARAGGRHKGADPDITLQAICDRLEAMRERTPRGRAHWQPPSVKMRLDRAVRLGLIA